MHPGFGTTYPYSLSHVLARFGYEVTVLTATPTSPTGQRLSGYEKNKIYFENDNGVRIIRLPVPAVKPFGILRRLLIYISFIILGLFSFPLISNSDYVFGFSPDAPFLLVPNLFFTRILRRKYILGVTDLWPDALFELGVVKNKVAKFLLRIVSISSYRAAPKILMITNDLKDGLMKYGIKENKIEVILLPIDLEGCKKFVATKSEVDPSLKDSSFVVLYSGIFGQMYDFKVLLESARLLEGYKDIVFVIRGNGERATEIKDLSNSLRIKNVVLRSSTLSRDTVLKYISISDVCVVPIASSPTSDRTLPSKVLEFWAYEKPVIAVSGGHLKQLIEKNGAGTTVPSGDRQDLAKAILYHYTHQEISRSMGISGRLLVEREYSYEQVGRQISAILKNIESG